MSPKKLAELNAIQQAREAHHKALERLAQQPGKGLVLWRRLRRLEVKASGVAVALCNGEILWADADIVLDAIRDDVVDILDRDIPGFFINRDPRGYALKLDSKTDYGLHRDMGGYQILAPTID